MLRARLIFPAVRVGKGVLNGFLQHRKKSFFLFRRSFLGGHGGVAAHAAKIVRRATVFELSGFWWRRFGAIEYRDGAVDSTNKLM